MFELKLSVLMFVFPQIPSSAKMPKSKMDLKYFSRFTLTVRVTGWPAIWGMPPMATMVRTLGSTPTFVVMVPWIVPVRSPTAS